jgi:hypothetical protein
VGSYEIALHAAWVIDELFSDFDFAGHGGGVGAQVGLYVLWRRWGISSYFMRRISLYAVDLP